MLRRSSVVIGVLFAFGCGGGGATPADGGGGAALIGTWGTSMCLAPDYTGCDYAVTFGAGGEYSIRQSGVKDAGTGLDGCTITLAASGYTWASTATTVTVAVGAAPSGTVMRTGCASSADDIPTATPNPDFTATSYALADAPYSISGSTLTLGGAGGLVLTRR